MKLDLTTSLLHHLILLHLYSLSLDFTTSLFALTFLLSLLLYFLSFSLSARTLFSVFLDLCSETLDLKGNKPHGIVLGLGRPQSLSHTNTPWIEFLGQLPFLHPVHFKSVWASPKATNAEGPFSACTNIDTHSFMISMMWDDNWGVKGNQS